MFDSLFLQQGNRYHKLRKPNSKFCRGHYELISKFNAGFKTILREGLSKLDFYSYLVYKFKKREYMIFLFRLETSFYKHIGYKLNVMRQSACLFLTQSCLITMLPYLVRLYDNPDLKLFILFGLGWNSLSIAWPTGVLLVFFFFCSRLSVMLSSAQGSPSPGSLLYLCVLAFDSSWWLS